MFINRHQELAALERMFQSETAQFFVLYGRRRVGAHWGSNLEIDMLTENVDDSHWFGECKWWNAPVGENVLNSLIEKTKKVPDQWKHHPRYVLFSVSGFTDALKQRSEKEGVFLIAANDLF